VAPGFISKTFPGFFIGDEEDDRFEHAAFQVSDNYSPSAYEAAHIAERKIVLRWFLK